MPHHSFTRIMAAASLMALAGAANAVPIDFSIAGGSGTASGFAIGSTVSISPSAGLVHGFTLDLDAASPSHTFDFLDVSVSGVGIVGGVIDASLSFLSPEATNADGLLVGAGAIAFFLSGGVVDVVTDPGPIAFGDGGLFDVDFHGFFDVCQLCTTIGGTVTATVSLLQAPNATPVPEPATLSLLGAGLIAFGVSRRRRRS